MTEDEGELTFSCTQEAGVDQHLGQVGAEGPGEDRAVFADRFFFKYKNGSVIVHTPEQVENIRHQIEKGVPLNDITADWGREMETFRKQCRPFLLYD